MSEGLEETLKKVRIHIEENNFDVALEMLNEIEDEPNLAMHYYYCVIAYQTGGDPDEMRHHAESGLRLDSEFESLHYYRFEAYKRLEQWSSAAIAGSEIIYRDAENYKICFEVADLFEKIGSAMDADVMRFKGHFAVARVYYAHQQIEKALAEIDLALGVINSNGNAILLKVSCLMALKRYDDVKLLITENLQRESIEVDLLTKACEIALMEEDYEQAKQACVRLLSMAPDYEYPRRILFNMSKTQGNVLGALNVLEELDEQDDDDIWTHLARYAYSHELSNDVTFINSQDNPQMFWKIVQVLYNSGVEEYAYRKIKEYKQTDTEFEAQLRKFCEMLFENDKNRAVDDLLSFFPIEEWNNIELMFLYGKNLSYVKNYAAQFEYFDMLAEKIGEQDKLMHQYALDKVLCQLHNYLTPLSEADVTRFTPIVCKSLEMFPKDGYVNYVYGGLLAFNRRWEEAEEYFIRARSIGLPTTASVYAGFWVAAMQYSLGRFDDAQEMFVEVFETRCHPSWNVEKFLAFKERIFSKSTEPLW